MLRKLVVMASCKSVPLVLACLMALSWTGTAQASSSDEVMAIYGLAERGEVEEAETRLEQLLESGDQDARGLLGIFFLFGIGRDADGQVAYELCSESAQHDQPMGMHCLGHIYSYGVKDVAERDHQQAAYWWSKAVAAGDLESMEHLASSYLNGQGVEKNVPEALWLLHMAADAGEKYAMIELGSMHEEGELLEKDLDKKFEYWLAATRLGIGDRDTSELGDVRLWVGNEILERFDDKQQQQEGIDLIRKLADSDYPFAWPRMGQLCLFGTYIPQDYDCAERWYEKASNSDWPAVSISGKVGLWAVDLFRAVY